MKLHQVASITLGLTFTISSVATAQTHPITNRQTTESQSLCYMHLPKSSNLSIDLSRLCARYNPTSSSSKRPRSVIPSGSAAVGVNNTGDLIGVPTVERTVSTDRSNSTYCYLPNSVVIGRCGK